MLENRTQRKSLLCNESFLFCLHMICSRMTDKKKMCKNMNQTTVHEYLKNSAIYLAKKKKTDVNYRLKTVHKTRMRNRMDHNSACNIVCDRVCVQVLNNNLFLLQTQKSVFFLYLLWFVEWYRFCLNAVVFLAVYKYSV